MCCSVFLFERSQEPSKKKDRDAGEDPVPAKSGNSSEEAKPWTVSSNHEALAETSSEEVLAVPSTQSEESKPETSLAITTIGGDAASASPAVLDVTVKSDFGADIEATETQQPVDTEENLINAQIDNLEEPRAGASVSNSEETAIAVRETDGKSESLTAMEPVTGDEETAGGPSRKSAP